MKKATDFYQGQLVIDNQGNPYQISEINEDDNSICLWDGDETSNGFWEDPNNVYVSVSDYLGNTNKKGHTIKNFLMRVIVNDKKCKEKYPNYRFNFDSSEDFINFIVSDVRKKHMKEYGYDIEITPIY